MSLLTFDDLIPGDARTPSEIDPDRLAPRATYVHVPATREQLLHAINNPELLYCGQQTAAKDAA